MVKDLNKRFQLNLCFEAALLSELLVQEMNQHLRSKPIHGFNSTTVEIKINKAKKNKKTCQHRHTLSVTFTFLWFS